MSKREIFFRPAFDRRSDDPKKNYGVHGVEIAFFLTGAEGVVQFIVYTNWQLPHVQSATDARPLNDHPYMFHKPMAADLGYHSRVPRHEGQTMLRDDCDLLGGPCYYDGSSLNAKPVFDVLLEKGSDGVWESLEGFYVEVFGVKAA